LFVWGSKRTTYDPAYSGPNSRSARLGGLLGVDAGVAADAEVDSVVPVAVCRTDASCAVAGKDCGDELAVAVAEAGRSRPNSR
jgi:hypothetical protein